MKNSKSKETQPIDTSSADFKNMVDLLAVYTDASNRLETLEADANKELLEILDEHRSDYAEAQEAATKAETALEQIALRHPEWFGKNRSISTPYGVIKFHASTKLNIENEQATIARLELMEAKNPAFKAAAFIRSHRECNVEALEKLDAVTLETLGIKVVPDDNFSVKPAKVKMDKAIAASAAKEEPLKAAA